MDNHFDELSKSLPEGISRREALRKFGTGLAGGLLAYSCLSSAKKAAAHGIHAGVKDYLVVGSYNNQRVLSYDEATGDFFDAFDPDNLAGLKNPVGGVFGSDGNLYVTTGIFNAPIHAVLQYSGKTGEFKRVFASKNITSPRGLLFGPDGNLYVANGNEVSQDDPASVLRFDGKSGAFMDDFVAPASGGLEHPNYMVFGPDGKGNGGLDLYISSAHAGSILRYDGSSGKFKGVFVAAATGGLDAPQGMVFGPDGNLYVASGNWFDGSNGPVYEGEFPPGAILRFRGPHGKNPGAFLDTFIVAGNGGLANPGGLLFGPGGDLFVANCVQSGKGNLRAERHTSHVLRYDGSTGESKGVFVAGHNGGLKFPTFLTFTQTDPTTLNYLGN